MLRKEIKPSLTDFTKKKGYIVIYYLLFESAKVNMLLIKKAKRKAMISQDNL